MKNISLIKKLGFGLLLLPIAYSMHLTAASDSLIARGGHGGGGHEEHENYHGNQSWNHNNNENWHHNYNDNYRRNDNPYNRNAYNRNAYNRNARSWDNGLMEGEALQNSQSPEVIYVDPNSGYNSNGSYYNNGLYYGPNSDVFKD